MPLEEIVRTKFGIQGLDSALKGGIPEGNIVLISGGAGTGKSTLALQYAVNGALLFGEKALYISTEQGREELIKQAAGFNWNINDLEQKSLVKIIYFDITVGENFMTKIDDAIQKFNPKRIVVDSLTTLTDSLLISGITDDSGFSMVQIAESVNPIPRTEQVVAKSILYKLFKELRKYRLTTLMTTELPESDGQLSADGVSEFIADGVIMLNYVGVGSVDFRSLILRKMRYTDHNKATIPYAMESNGIVIKESEI
ncbi:MAG: ATPase domain-containing protein [archaeon]|jgi:circadian clock protein KaiC